jgi:poly(A) polymerase Pap1
MTMLTRNQVPIISLFLDGIDFDIGFSQTNLTTLDSGHTLSVHCNAADFAAQRHSPLLCLSDFVASDALLENMDKRCKTSINGKRVTDAIAALLPSKDRGFDANITVFRTVIRFLKHWSKRRCVYAPSSACFLHTPISQLIITQVR